MAKAPATPNSNCLAREEAGPGAVWSESSSQEEPAARKGLRALPMTSDPRGRAASPLAAGRWPGRAGIEILWFGIPPHVESAARKGLRALPMTSDPQGNQPLGRRMVGGTLEERECAGVLPCHRIAKAEMPFRCWTFA